MTMQQETATGNGTRRKGRVQVPENESREQQFVRLAEKRVTAIKAKIRGIKNLARYPHTEDQAAKIVDALKAMATDIESAFNPVREQDDFKF